MVELKDRKKGAVIGFWMGTYYRKHKLTEKASLPRLHLHRKPDYGWMTVTDDNAMVFVRNSHFKDAKLITPAP